MQVEQYKGVAEASEGFASISRAYRVDSPQLVFDLLCNKLYAHPLPTMIQEYMANARDAHREVNKQSVPISVTLPTSFEPHMYIRDFGPGLTEQRINDVFISLGASTKQESDEMTGGFGLGAKIGWAYGDSFTVISVVDGIESTYLSYKDETGMGQMSTLTVRETDEVNGVTIKLKIKNEDVHKVRGIVEKVSYFWDTKPDCNETIRHYEREVESDFVLHVSPFADSGVFAVVDGIPYEILISNTPILEQIKTANSRNSAAFLFFDVPEIDVAINREGLRYSNKTIDAINYVIQKVIDENRRKVDYAKNITNYNKKVQALRECYTQLGAPVNTVCAISPFMYLRFSYRHNLGRLCILGSSTPGSRTAVYAFNKNTNILKNIQIKYSDSARNLHGLSDNESFPMPSLRELENTIGYPSRVLDITNNNKYVLLTSEEELSVGINKEIDRLRTIAVNLSTYSREDVLVTDNKVLFDILTKYENYTDIRSIEPTYVEKERGNYGSRACNFTDRDVKNVKDRKNTLDIDDLLDNVHMWCTVRERAKVLKMKSTYNIQMLSLFNDKECYYLTAPQIEYMKYKEVPHFSEVYAQALKNKKVELFERFMKVQSKLKNATYVHNTYIESTEARSIHRALADHINDINVHSTFHNYVQAKVALEVAESGIMDNIMDDIVKYSELLKRNYFNSESADDFTLVLSKKRPVYRMGKTVRLWREKTAKESSEVIKKFHNAHPLLHMMLPTFPGKKFRSDEHNEVIKHIISYLNAKK